MGATYSVADGVFDEVDGTQGKEHESGPSAHGLRKWVNDMNLAKGGFLLKFLKGCDNIASYVACRSTPRKRSPRRLWSTNEGDEGSTDSTCTIIPEKLSVSCFNIGATVGTGSYATVCLASLRDNQGNKSTPCALKVLHKTKVLEERQVAHVKNEKNILSSIRHPFIVKFLASFQDEVNVYLLLEYVCGGELFSYIYKYGALGYNIATFYTAQAVLAIDFLHYKNIVYRDLKPENMLLDMFGHIRLVDFGFAKVIKNQTYTVCGTHDYLAPEIFLRCGHGVDVDWWSLGILVYELLMGTPPFHSNDPFITYDLALENRIRFPLSVKYEVKDFIRRLLVVNPKKRLGSANPADIYGHKFFECIDWVKMLSKQLKPPIVPKVKGIMDTSNYMAYPDVWRSYAGTITKQQQDEFFSDF